MKTDGTFDGKNKILAKYFLVLPISCIAGNYIQISIIKLCFCLL